MSSSDGSPPSKRRADGRLAKLIERHDRTHSVLPLVHTTRAYVFDEIIANDTLAPRSCEIFSQDLIYCFYGRPAFRVKDGNNARLEFEWPIVFILDTATILSIERLFPFDTGAFALGLYASFFDKNSKMLDFKLDPTLESAQKFVGFFYVDNDEYYYGASRKNVDVPLRQFEASGILELSRLPGVQSTSAAGRTRDERSSALEIQLNRPIPLRDALLAIVLPLPYMDDTEIQEALARWRPKNVRTYGTIHNVGGEGWVGQIYQIVGELYSMVGILR